MEKRLLGRIVLAVGVLGAPALWWKYSSNLEAGQTEFASADLERHPAELSIRPVDEPFSVPDRGSSLFDKIFSQKNAQGVREYNVPYPFTRLLKRTREVSGVSPQISLFPMGRSLQRSAAVEGMKEIKNLDPFFRFPRIVLGFDQESLNSSGQPALNLKERLYIGMNEKAKLLEVISYNDEAGRFEYQVVRDFEQGKSPKVFYANRQLCLSCHQNQTPIFSRAPWTESNANPAMQENLQRILQSSFGDRACASEDDPFCYRDVNSEKKYFYWGSEVAIDQKVSYSIDQTTKAGNYFHGYHKMWQRLCQDMECRKALLKQIFLYKLAGQKGLLQSDGVKAFNQYLIQKWKKEFPNGMKIPEAAIPNRDPLLNQKDRGREDHSLVDGRQSHVKTGLEQVLANSDVPGEFEPLLPRPPSELWESPLLEDQQIARLVAGYASFFTSADVKLIDDILVQNPVDSSLIENLSTTCKIKRGSSADRPDFSITCDLNSAGQGIKFSTYLRIPPGGQDLIGTSRVLTLSSPLLTCADGLCAQVQNLITRLRKNASGIELAFQFQEGFSLRFLDGRRLGSLQLPDLNLGEEKVVVVPFQILRDAGPLVLALDTADKAGSLKKVMEGPALNRLAVMEMVLGFLGKPTNSYAILNKEMQSLKKATEAPDDEVGELPIKPNERAVALATHNCSSCHYNREGVPPAFLGGPQQPLEFAPKCRLVSICSARMLYRLKMWACPDTDFNIKKTPMPPTARMRTMTIDLEKWKRTERVQLIESLSSIFPAKEVAEYLVKQGVSTAEAQAVIADLKKPTCPQSTSTIFEKLPHCEKEFSTPASLCQ